MAILITFWQILQSVFTCAHTRAQGVEGKTFCPDCGRGVLFTWTVLHCQGCGVRRPTRYLYRQVAPQHTCCTACGDHLLITKRLYDPEVYQLRHALLQCQEDSFDFTGSYRQALAWVDDVKKSVISPAGKVYLISNT